MFAREQVLAGVIGVNRVCKLCGISKKTYYQAKNPNEKLNDKYKAIKTKIKKIIKDNSHYGIRRIKADLLDKYNVVIGKETLGKLLKIWGLNLKRKSKRKRITALQALLLKLRNKTNLIIRSIIIKPLQAVSSDITVILYNNGNSKCYLCVHKDIVGQMVYGYDVRLNMEKELVINSFKQAIKYINKNYKGAILDNIIFHQDQGSQYTSYEYVDAVLSVGKISYSAPGTPTDNPGQESFFGRFKEECSDELLECKSFKQVEKLINKKIRYYNNKRIHTNAYTTPKILTENLLKNH